MGEYRSNGVGCDPKELIQRPHRTKNIKNKLLLHQGRISTGNRVIQDSSLRDPVGMGCDGGFV